MPRTTVLRSFNESHYHNNLTLKNTLSHPNKNSYTISKLLQWLRRLCKGSHQVCQSPSARQNSHKGGVKKTFLLWPSPRSLRSVQGCPGLSYHHVPKFHNPATTSSRKNWHDYIQNQCFPPLFHNKTRPLHEISLFALTNQNQTKTKMLQVSKELLLRLKEQHTKTYPSTTRSTVMNHCLHSTQNPLSFPLCMLLPVPLHLGTFQKVY